MKTGTDSHPKFKNLVALLDLRYYEAIGILEGIWQLAMMSANKGDIGKFTNEEISNTLQWRGDADGLIDALVKSRWLDAVEDDRRLVIHDWHDHAPDFIRKRLVYNGEMFNSFRSDSQRTAYILRESQRKSKTRSDSRDKPLHHVPNHVPNQDINIFPPSDPPPTAPLFPEPPQAAQRKTEKKAVKESKPAKEGSGPTLEEKNWFIERWQETYPGEVPDWKTMAGTWVHLATKLKTHPMAEIRKRWLEFLQDGYEGFRGHSFPIFLTRQFNRYGPQPVGVRSNGNGRSYGNDENPPGWEQTLYGKNADPDKSIFDQGLER